MSWPKAIFAAVALWSVVFVGVIVFGWATGVTP